MLINIACENDFYDRAQDETSIDDKVVITSMRFYRKGP